jgi:hypothetical protein
MNHYIYIIIYNSQTRIYSKYLPVQPNVNHTYQWHDIHFPYSIYFFNFMLDSPNGNIQIPSVLKNLKIVKTDEKFELIELTNYKIHINEGLKITCMLNSIYLGRANSCKKDGGRIKYKWISSVEEHFLFLFSPRGEKSLSNLKDDARDLKLIRQAVSSGFDLTSVFVMEEEEEESKNYIPDSASFKNENYKLPCILRHEERFVRLKIYNFKFTPPKCAEMLFKIVKGKKKLKARAFDGKLKARLKIEGGIKIKELKIEADNEEVLEFNKIQKGFTI